MKYSLMTMPLAFPVIAKHFFDHDEEEMREAYCEMLDLIADAGYRAVDVMDLEIRMFGREALREQLESRGLRAACVLYMQGFGGAGDEAVRDAVFLGADVLMLVPAYREEYASMTPEEIRHSLAQIWTPLTDKAIKAGLCVVAEDTPDLRLHFCTREEVADVLKNVPGLKFVYDCGNVLLVHDDPVAYFRYFAKETAHVHLKDMESDREDKCAVLGSGLVDIASVMEALTEAGYNGWVTIELKVDEKKGVLRSLRDALAYAKECEKKHKEK